MNAIYEFKKDYIIDVLFFSYPDHKCEIVVGDNIASVKELAIKKTNFIKRFWIHPIFSRRFNKSILKEIQSIANDYNVLYFDFSQVALY